MPRVGEMMTIWGHSACAGLHSIPFSPKHHLELSSERGKSKNFSWWDVTFQVGGTGQHSHLTDRSLNHAMQSQAAHSPQKPLKNPSWGCRRDWPGPPGWGWWNWFSRCWPHWCCTRRSRSSWWRLQLCQCSGQLLGKMQNISCWFAGSGRCLEWEGEKTTGKVQFFILDFFFFFCRFQSLPGCAIPRGICYSALDAVGFSLGFHHIPSLYVYVWPMDTTSRS